MPFLNTGVTVAVRYISGTVPVVNKVANNNVEGKEILLAKWNLMNNHQGQNYAWLSIYWLHAKQDQEKNERHWAQYQLHKMQHGGKTNLLIWKKLSDFGRIISLPNAENRAKVCHRTAEIFWCIFIARQHTDARYWYSNSVRLSVCLSVRPSVHP